MVDNKVFKYVRHLYLYKVGGNQGLVGDSLLQALRQSCPLN